MTKDPAQICSTRPIGKGTRLGGIFEIDELISLEGMAEVYKGHSIKTGDLVALKVLQNDLAENALDLSLFGREVSALHNISSEAIVRYHVFSVDPILGRPYLAMEYLEGDPLTFLVRQGPLPLGQAVALLRRVAAGLQAAHERGIIHRDVCPDKIIIPDNTVTKAKIIDFGIAKTTNMVRKTSIGEMIVGEFDYASPEQLGLFGGEVTHKSDIYSLGLVLAEMLNGYPIDMGRTNEEIVESRITVPDLSSLNPQIRPLVEKMLQPDPALRPASMAEILAWPISATVEEVEQTLMRRFASRCSVVFRGWRPLTLGADWRSMLLRGWRFLTLGVDRRSALLAAGLAAIAVETLVFVPYLIGSGAAKNDSVPAGGVQTAQAFSVGAPVTSLERKAPRPGSLDDAMLAEIVSKARAAAEAGEKRAAALRQQQVEERIKSAQAESERQQDREGALRLAEQQAKEQRQAAEAVSEHQQEQESALRLAKHQAEERRKVAEAESERRKEQDDALHLAAQQAETQGLGRLTRSVQEELRRLGCFKAKITGSLDVPTREGLARYLSSHDANSGDGTISETLLNGLRQQQIACPETSSPKRKGMFYALKGEGMAKATEWKKDGAPVKEAAPSMDHHMQHASICRNLLERAQLGESSPENRAELSSCR